MQNSICVRILFCKIGFLHVESYFPRPKIVFGCGQILISAPGILFSVSTHAFTIAAHENMISSVQFLISVEEIKISAGGRARRLRFQHARFLSLIYKIGFGGQILFLISKIVFEVNIKICFPERPVRNPILNIQILLCILRKSYSGLRIG